MDVDRLTLRTIEEGEFAAFARAVDAHFGEVPSDEGIARWRKVTEIDRTFAALDGGRIVGTCGAYSFTISVPGGDPAPCAGVTVVGVAADWRRRGLLTRMMRTLLDQASERGEPFAALFASESSIYGRFGFGIGAELMRVSLAGEGAQLTDPPDTGAVRLVDPATAMAAFPPIYEAARSLRSGLMSRRPEHWSVSLEHDDSDQRDGAGPRQLGLLDGRGYVAFRLKPDWEAGAPEGELRVLDLQATDPEAYATMWQFVFQTDLARRWVAWHRPVDDPLGTLVRNHQRALFTTAPDLWVRLVDVPSALSSRRYGADGRLVLEVRDRFVPGNDGRFALEVSDGLPTCVPVDADPDLVLDVADLAAMSLGAHTATRLAWGRRIDQRRPGALALADRMFHVGLAPLTAFEF